MPTKDTFNATTGLLETVEMEGEELAAYEALRAIPEPTLGATRDERLLEAVKQAKIAVAAGPFSEAQAAVLSAVFDGLGAAISVSPKM